MRVLNICHSDWANFAYDNMMALRSVGIECRGAKLTKHDYGYQEQLQVLELEQIRNLIHEFDVIQFFHDNVSMFRAFIPDLSCKKVIAYHTSSYYRRYTDLVNSAMNPLAHRSVCAMPEFIGKGARNEIYMVGAVTDYFQTYNQCTNRFAHLPSNPKIKGTDQIVKMFEGEDIWLLHSELPRQHHQQLYLTQSCMVYVEMFQMTDGNGMAYGNFGITALEAASMGKVVITNCVNLDIYEKTYGRIGLQICNNEIDFIETIQRFQSMEASRLRSFMENTRAWYLKNHSYQASGEYMLKNILN